MLVESAKRQLHRWAAVTRARTVLAARGIFHAKGTGLSGQEGVRHTRRLRNEGNVDPSSTSDIGLTHGRPHVGKIVVG